MWRANKLTASEYDETAWSARTWMAFATQRLSVVVQYSAAQEVAEALGLSVAAETHERRSRWAARGVTLGEPWGTGVSSHRDHHRAMRVCCLSCVVVLFEGFDVAESECSVFSPE